MGVWGWARWGSAHWLWSEQPLKCVNHNPANSGVLLCTDISWPLRSWASDGKQREYLCLRSAAASDQPPLLGVCHSVCVTRCVSTAEAAKLHQTNLKKKVFPARLSTTVSVTSCVLSYFMFVHYYGLWNDLINIVDVTCLYSQQTTNLRPEHTQCPAPPISLLVVLFCFWLHRELLFSSAVIKVAQTVHWQTDSFSFNVWFNSFGLQLQLQRAEMLRLRFICGRCFIWIQSNHERLSQKQKHTEILIS